MAGPPFSTRKPLSAQQSYGRLLHSVAHVRPGQALVFCVGALSLFALSLQLGGKEAPERVELMMTGGLEHDLMVQQLHLPKLKLSLAQHLGQSNKLQRPLPEGLGGQAWRPQQQALAEHPNIAFVATTSDPLQQIRIWISYHKAIGISAFYIFADGQAARADNVAALRALPGVTVVLRDAELRRRHENSRIWKETWLSAFFNKPCNHELFVLQSLNMEVAIEMALLNKVDWLLHVDTDELIFPSGSPAFSLKEVLSQVPPDVDTLVFPNYESLPERDDVVDPFLEVSLFKKNYAHVVSDLYFKSYGAVARGNPNYFITYGNGKSAARVQQGMRPNGAHRWHSYVKTPKESSSDQAAVLHFTYNRFSDLKSRRDRCDCVPTEEDAKRCFILPFDRLAFLEASLKNDTELMDWFRQRLVWSDPAIVSDLLKKGLFTRIYEPQLMIRGFIAAEKEAEKEAATSAAAAAETSRLQQQLAAAQAAALQASNSRGSAGANQGVLPAGADPGAASVGTASSSALGAVQKAAAVLGQQVATEQVAAGSIEQQQAKVGAADQQQQQAAATAAVAATQQHTAAVGIQIQQLGGGGGTASGEATTEQAATLATGGSSGGGITALDPGVAQHDAAAAAQNAAALTMAANTRQQVSRGAAAKGAASDPGLGMVQQAAAVAETAEQ